MGRSKQLFILVFGILYTSCTGNLGENEVQSPTSTILKATNSRPLSDITIEKTAERLARGKYLAEGLYCLTCHTDRDTTKAGWPPLMEKKFSGALRFKTDSTHLYAPNLTPDIETGIGSFTDDMLSRAIREGVGHDGRRLVPVGMGGMPSGSFRNLTDEDLASIIVYMRSIPPIKNEIPKRNIGRHREEQIQNRWHPVLDDLEEPNFTDPVNHGKYLISVSDCMGCHTGWDGRNPGVFAGGNEFGHDGKNLVTPNISSDPTGIGNWTAETFISIMKTGKNGLLDPVMPWISYRNLSNEDLTDIYLALKQTQPVRHLILNGAEPSYCEICETEHGLGSANHLEEFHSFSEDFQLPLDYAGRYVNQIFNGDTLKITISDNRLILNDFTFIPVNETDFLADGFFAPIRFNRDLNGKIASLNFRTLGRNYFRKIE